MATPAFRVSGRAGANAHVHVLHLAGAITHATAPLFQDAVNALDTSTNVILDMTEVPSVDSMAIGALVRAYVFCNKSGRRLALVGVNHRVSNVLRLTGVDSLFDTYGSIPEAESALSA